MTMMHRTSLRTSSKFTHIAKSAFANTSTRRLASNLSTSTSSFNEPQRCERSLLRDNQTCVTNLPRLSFVQPASSITLLHSTSARVASHKICTTINRRFYSNNATATTSIPSPNTAAENITILTNPQETDRQQLQQQQQQQQQQQSSGALTEVDKLKRRQEIEAKLESGLKALRDFTSSTGFPIESQELLLDVLYFNRMKFVTGMTVWRQCITEYFFARYPNLLPEHINEIHDHVFNTEFRYRVVRQLKISNLLNELIHIGLPTFYLPWTPPKNQATDVVSSNIATSSSSSSSSSPAATTSGSTTKTTTLEPLVIRGVSERDLSFEPNNYSAQFSPITETQGTQEFVEQNRLISLFYCYLGVLYTEKGMQACNDFVSKHVIGVVAESGVDVAKFLKEKDPQKVLYALVFRGHLDWSYVGLAPQYRVEPSGDGFRVTVSVGDTELGSGSSKSIEKAHKIAAQEALNNYYLKYLDPTAEQSSNNNNNTSTFFSAQQQEEEEEHDEGNVDVYDDGEAEAEEEEETGSSSPSLQHK